MFQVKKRCFAPDSPFFEEGNLVCRWLQEQRHGGKTPELHFDDAPTGLSSIQCQLHGCLERFSSLSSYEDHYASKHKNICQTCGKLLPSTHLLDLHIDENHNPMFDILAAKSPMYKCLVLGCHCVFKSSGLRRKHLIEDHKYPSSFRFDRKHKKRVKDKQDDQMDIADSPADETAVGAVSSSRFRYSYTMPQSFSFGHGVPRGFIRRKRGNPRGNHLTGRARSKPTLSNGEVDADSMDMQELASELDRT